MAKQKSTEDPLEVDHKPFVEYDVPGVGRPLVLSPEHAAELKAKPHVADESESVDEPVGYPA